MLEPHHAFGYKATLKHPVVYVNDSEIAFVVGRQVAVQNVATLTIRFLPSSLDHTDLKKTSSTTHRRLGIVNAINICRQRKYLAVLRASCDTQASTVSIYRFKSSNAAELQSCQSLGNIESFASCAFSSDSKLLLVQSSRPPYSLEIWDWIRARKIAAVDVRLAVSTVYFNPMHKGQVSTSGPKHLRLWRVADKSLEVLALSMNSNHKGTGFKDHCWTLVGEILVALTDHNELHIIKDGEVIQTFNDLHSGRSIQCLTASSARHIVLGGDEGIVTVLDVADSHGTKFTVQRTSAISDRRINALVFQQPSAESVLVVSANKLELSRVSNNDSTDGGDSSTMENLTGGELPTTVRDSAICARRPLIVSCNQREDCNSFFVSGWDYLKRESVFVESYYSEGPVVSVDCHPMGYQLVVAFESKLLLYFVLKDSLKLSQEIFDDGNGIIKVRYSPGGGYIMTLHNNMMTLYSTFGSEGAGTPLATRVGRFCNKNSDISDVVWTHDDLGLFSISQYSIISYFQMSEIDYEVPSCTVSTGHELTSVGVGPAHSLVVAFTSEGGNTLRCWRHYRHAITATDKSDAAETSVINDKVVAIVLDIDHTIYAATTSGSVYVVSWTCSRNDDNSTRLSLVKCIDIHESRISSLSLTASNSLLISSSVDGSVFVTTSMTNSHNNITQSEDDNSICLVKRSSIAQQNAAYTKLQSSFSEMEAKLKIDASNLKETYENQDALLRHQLKSLQSQSQEETSALSRQLEFLQKNAAENMEVVSKENKKSVIAIENEFAQKLKAASATIDKLKSEITTLKENAIDSTYAAEEHLVCVKEELQKEFDAKLASAEAQHSALRDSIAETKKAYEEMLVQQDEDHMKQLSDLQASVCADTLKSEEKHQLALGEVSLLQQNFHLMHSALKEKDSVIEEAKFQTLSGQDKLLALQTHTLKLQEDLKQAQRQYKELEGTNATKDSVIADLERSCRVTSHQLKALEQKFRPQAEESERLKLQLQELHLENKRNVDAANALDLELESKARVIHRLEQSIDSKESKIRLQKSFLNDFSAEIANILESISSSDDSSFDTLRNRLRNVHQTFVTTRPEEMENVMEHRDEQSLAIRELMMQKKMMEKNITSLQDRLSYQKRQQGLALKKSVAQATAMLNEINELRRSNHALTLQLSQKPPITSQRSSNNNFKIAGARPVISKTMRPASAANHKKKIVRPGSAIIRSKKLDEESERMALRSSIKPTLRPKSAASSRRQRP